jgi:hypothetical protein
VILPRVKEGMRAFEPAFPAGHTDFNRNRFPVVMLERYSLMHTVIDKKWYSRKAMLSANTLKIYLLFTSIIFGFASGALGREIERIPFLKEASILSAVMFLGRVKFLQKL